MQCEHSEFVGYAFLPAARLDFQQLVPALLNTPRLAFGIVDRQMRYLAVNQAVSDANGISRQDHLGKTLFDILGQGAEKVAGPVEYVFRSGVSSYTFEVATDPDRLPTIRRWQMSLFPIRAASGKILRVASTALEIIGESQQMVANGHRRLSIRERQVVRGIADGKGTKEIAVDLKLSTRTVETYRARLMYKLQIHSPGALVMYAVQNKLI
jgi:two-component system, NarL family, response regulator NreC